MRLRQGRIGIGSGWLSYRVTGFGPPVVLLHGFGFDCRMWDDHVPHLSNRYAVVQYDLRGFGRSTAGRDSYSHADDLKALVDDLGLDRVALIGLSLGGGAALNFSIQYPERVRALVVVDPSLGGFGWSSQFTEAQQALRSTASTVGIAAAREQWLQLPMFRSAMSNPRVAERLASMVNDYAGWHWLEPELGRPLHPPAIDRLQEISAPTLVMVGELDTADFHDIASTIADRVPRARKVVIPGVGHMANLEAPARFDDLVAAFLAEASAEP
jgi:pimeloyl-ACP methyl ester carboxylesterase